MTAKGVYLKGWGWVFDIEYRKPQMWVNSRALAPLTGVYTIIVQEYNSWKNAAASAQLLAFIQRDFFQKKKRKKKECPVKKEKL